MDSLFGCVCFSCCGLSTKRQFSCDSFLQYCISCSSQSCFVFVSFVATSLSIFIHCVLFCSAFVSKAHCLSCFVKLFWLSLVGVIVLLFDLLLLFSSSSSSSASFPYSSSSFPCLLLIMILCARLFLLIVLPPLYVLCLFL